jgi:1,4-alpha-glucan branching enzyme
MVIYEMHLGTFNDSPGGSPGTWASAQAKTAAPREALGVNMIEVLPISEFAGDFSWGYNPGHHLRAGDASTAR